MDPALAEWWVLLDDPELTRLVETALSENPSLQAAQARIAQQMPLIAAASPALYDDAGGLLEPGVLEAVDIPALLLEGSEAPTIIPAINEALAARLPRARRGVIAGAGHMSVATHPDQVSAEILAFLREV